MTVMHEDPNAHPAPRPPVKVRTTMRPWEEIEVPAGEDEVLRHQGLLYDGPPVTEKDFDEHNNPKPPVREPKPDDKAAAKAPKTKEAGQ